MAKAVKLSPATQVTEHIQKLDPEFGKLIQKIREIILETDKEISEHIKWNNPAFYYSGEMKPFDPKEYKRDLIVMNLFKNRVMLVFPSGAKLKKHTKLLEGDYKDGRRLIIFKDREAIESSKKEFQLAIKEWLSLVEK